MKAFVENPIQEDVKSCEKTLIIIILFFFCENGFQGVFLLHLFGPFQHLEYGTMYSFTFDLKNEGIRRIATIQKVTLNSNNGGFLKV